jgi:phosphoglucomutase
MNTEQDAGRISSLAGEFGEPVYDRIEACATAAQKQTLATYKIYAEGFRGAAHLQRLLAEAQRIVDAALSAPSVPSPAAVAIST